MNVIITVLTPTNILIIINTIYSTAMYQSTRVVTNDVSDSYQQIYVIAHIICNHTICLLIQISLSII